MRIKKKKQTENFQNSDLRNKAGQGDANAQYLLGGLYDIGQDMPQDYEKARQWYEQAVVQDQVEAQYNLGVLYYERLGVPQDTTKARELFEKADVQRYADSRAV